MTKLKLLLDKFIIYWREKAISNYWAPLWKDYVSSMNELLSEQSDRKLILPGGEMLEECIK